MKLSIIIVAYKAHEQLIRCLESLVRNPPASGRTSRADAEIILIDNSPDEIQKHISNDFLIKILQTYTEMKVEWHPENPGFAAACNRGVGLSSGENIVFVNPDTEVFPEWSERMLAHLKPGVGAIGPISNFVAGFQNSYFHMKTVEPWDKMARYAANGLDKRAVETKMLIGFFFMLPRVVWDKVGGMDPQFILGCDDLDLSMRIREAGYSLLIASDVFVYHEGHASFKEAGKALEMNKQSEKRLLAKLAEVYGDQIPSSTELWGCEILPTYIPKRQTLSVCMIVRNEIENLRALEQQLGFADEVVLVDTDPGIVKDAFDNWFTTSLPINHQNIRAYSFPWTDSFAEARNFALSKCTSDWVLWLDADDRVTPESAALIRAALDNPGPMTQAKTCHFSMIIRDHGPDGINYANGQPRLFPRVPGLEWTGRVHETYLPAAEKLGITQVRTDIIIDHTGYMDPAVMLKKHARNLRLMQMEPDSPMKFYQMGRNHLGLAEYAKAEECFNRVLDGDWGGRLDTEFRDQVRYCLASLAYTVNRGGCDAMIPYLDDNGKPDAAFMLGEAMLKRGDVAEAERLYRHYLTLPAVGDYYGSQTEYFQRVAKGRLETITKVREKVHAQ